MNYIKTQDKTTGEEIQLSYEDYGQGDPIVLLHGWPLSKEMWEYQLNDLVDGGYRCILYDRRGFGKSSRPWNGYDYDSLTDDLKAVMDALDLQNVMLVGFSMGGGEVVRYFGNYGGARVSKVVLIGSVTPYLAKTSDNPDGVDTGIFDEMMANIKEDRINFLDSFGKGFFGVGVIDRPMSGALLEYYRMLASIASPRATSQCVVSFGKTDFRSDLKVIHVPTLIIHGDSDKIVPIESSSELTQKLVADNQYRVYENAPHGLFYTHRKELNEDLLNFL